MHVPADIADFLCSEYINITENSPVLKHRWNLSAGLVVITSLFLYLRIKTVGHLLMWDEAWNILSLRAFLLNAKASPFFWHYNTHPPLYMTFAAFLKPLCEGVDIRLEWLSLIFAYGTLLAAYFLSAKIGGLRYAWLSGLFLSVMPYSVGYDAWIKQDGLASMLGYAAVFLVLKRKFLWCAVCLSFALLSKESAAFFIISVFIFMFFLKEEGKLRKYLSMCLIIAALTSWWYLLFEKPGEYIIDMYFSQKLDGGIWKNSHLLYVKQLLPNLGMPLFLFFIAGIVYLAYQIFHKKEVAWALPLIVALSTYIPAATIFSVEAPWYTLSARPAMAMIAGGGALGLIQLSKKIRRMLPLAIACIMVPVLYGFGFSYSGYHEKTYPEGWFGAEASRKLAQHLNRKLKEGDRFLITEFAYWDEPRCVIFSYYCRHAPEGIISWDMPVSDILKLIVDDKISWLVVVASPEEDSRSHKLVRDLKETSLGNPEEVHWSYVWDTRRLWERTGT